MNALTSPLLPRPPVLGGGDPAVTAQEVAAIVELARARRAVAVTVGSGRTRNALAAAEAIAAAWQAAGGRLAAAVTWPESAASWLRQAARFTAADTDLWVMTGPEVGWAQMTRRLLWSTLWRPERTLATAAVGRPATLALVGAHHLRGLSGAAADGSVWTVTADGRLAVGEKPSRSVSR